MAEKTYLITGAARGTSTFFRPPPSLIFPGIGRGMFNHYVAQPNNTIIAAVRSVSSAQSLLNVSRGNNTKVILTKIDSASTTDSYTAVEELKAKGIERIDVVISAAGIAKLNTIEDMPLEEYMEVLQINAISVMLLYKATLPLLRAAPAPARFVFISAAGGSLNDMPKYPYPNYASSKALANVLVVKMGMENEWLISLCIHPGLVQTDMGNAGAKAFGLEEAPLSLEDSSRNTAHIVSRQSEDGRNIVELTENRSRTQRKKSTRRSFLTKRLIVYIHGEFRKVRDPEELSRTICGVGTKSDKCQGCFTERPRENDSRQLTSVLRSPIILPSNKTHIARSSPLRISLSRQKGRDFITPNHRTFVNLHPGCTPRPQPLNRSRKFLSIPLLLHIRQRVLIRLEPKNQRFRPWQPMQCLAFTPQYRIFNPPLILPLFLCQPFRLFRARVSAR
jgi:norsolorinic acid ketoreductase